MSIVVVPGQFHAEPHPAGKLASTLLSVAMAGLADPGRFRRGKQYVADHAVSRLELEPGRLRATVAGSDAAPYQVEVHVPLLPAFDQATSDALRQQLTRITPEPVDISTRCTCPDPEAPCKHAVAAVLAMAAELVAQPRLLVQWRCAPGDSSRAEVGSRASGRPQLRLVGRDELPPEPEVAAPPPSVTRPPVGGSKGRPTVPAAPAPAPNPFAEPEWVAFLGVAPSTDLPPVPDIAAGTARTMAGNVDVGAVVRSALEVLTNHG
ncbi:MAG: SWIM zinc finger family protein [Actinomycetota bacterium]